MPLSWQRCLNRLVTDFFESCPDLAMSARQIWFERDGREIMYCRFVIRTREGEGDSDLKQCKLTLYSSEERGPLGWISFDLAGEASFDVSSLDAYEFNRIATMIRRAKESSDGTSRPSTAA